MIQVFLFPFLLCSPKKRKKQSFIEEKRNGNLVLDYIFGEYLEAPGVRNPICNIYHCWSAGVASTLLLHKNNCKFMQLSENIMYCTLWVAYSWQKCIVHDNKQVVEAPRWRVIKCYPEKSQATAGTSSYPHSFPFHAAGQCWVSISMQVATREVVSVIVSFCTRTPAPTSPYREHCVKQKLLQKKTKEYQKTY